MEEVVGAHTEYKEQRHAKLGAPEVFPKRGRIGKFFRGSHQSWIEPTSHQFADQAAGEGIRRYFDRARGKKTKTHPGWNRASSIHQADNVYG